MNTQMQSKRAAGRKNAGRLIFAPKALDLHAASGCIVELPGARLLAAFAALRGQDPAGEAAQALVRKWQDFITANYYTCTKEILAGLGQMYTADERFTRNIDKQGEGTAELMARAIEAYCRT